MEFLNEFTAPVVIGICLCVGYIIKNIVPTQKANKFIPLILGLLGMAVNLWIEMSFTPEGLLVGLVSGLASTGLYEAFHQFLKKHN